MTKLSPEQLKERHQEKMVKDLVKTSDKWAKEHGINMKDIPPDEPIQSLRETKVKYRTAKTGIRYKETLVGTITGEAARLLIDAHEKGESYMHSYDPNNMDKLQLWRTEIVE